MATMDDIDRSYEMQCGALGKHFYFDSAIKKPRFPGASRRLHEFSEVFFEIERFSERLQPALYSEAKGSPVDFLATRMVIDFADFVEINELMGCIDEPHDGIRIENRLEGNPCGNTEIMGHSEGFNPLFRQRRSGFPFQAFCRVIRGERDGEFVSRIFLQDIEVPGCAKPPLGKDLDRDIVVPEERQCLPGYFMLLVDGLIWITGETEQYRVFGLKVGCLFSDLLNDVCPGARAIVKFLPVAPGGRRGIAILTSVAASSVKITSQGRVFTGLPLRFVNDTHNTPPLFSYYTPGKNKCPTISTN